MMRMNETTLVRSTPESVGISSRELLKMVQALEKSGTEMHGIMPVSYTHLDVYKRQAVHRCGYC